ncbi:recombinase family protein [Sphingomonas sp. M1-B02]|uniref:recombinase family protein n=1 Tax=Sphingomonas sp. M1-B02 TaxID=3114300 RepID=UPI00224036AF|nr:recombinase family protein [Sphingomonas sp. S6-11]UZK67310.1 recombinase family protein [Sphingomonas sp. S6-11]
MKTVRCAIYTRKSSEEGLEQAFNSLDAQREACAAYILSQASEGWTALPEVYDDGGLSGGSLERPALQRLLLEVAAGRVDIIVVYKVDRLTRSLIDFSKLVEAFDKAGTSFVSVTQSFNTTTSMGRLTLNMLLSFAQFEREVTAERIRDKIAASKAKGMWMGGIPPLGYKANGRTLTIVDEHAAVVREIYARYLVLGNVRQLAEQLERDGVIAPERMTASGKAIGGHPFSRGQLYMLLKCRTYVGEIAHREHVFPGLHDGIIDREVWDKVQERLADNVQGARQGQRAENVSLFAGKISDADGERLIAVHASKGQTRYRYYVSRSLQRAEATYGLRIPATEIETAVAERLAQLFDDPLCLAAAASLAVHPSQLGGFYERSRQISPGLRSRSRKQVRDLVSHVRIYDRRIEIECDSAAVTAALNMPHEQHASPSFTITADVRLTRSGHVMRLIHNDGARVSKKPAASLIKPILQARRWWEELRTGGIDVTSLAKREGLCTSYISRVVRLAFLSPSIVDAILRGEQQASVDRRLLTSPNAIPAAWAKQAALVLSPSARDQ